jgi:hypothetical protein
MPYTILFILFILSKIEDATGTLKRHLRRLRRLRYSSRYFASLAFCTDIAPLAFLSPQRDNTAAANEELTAVRSSLASNAGVPERTPLRSGW